MKKTLLLTHLMVVMLTLSLVLLIASPAYMSGLTGAIWTTNANCSRVDMNIYGAKEDVYLNGGPRVRSGSGLPDGHYYFQVTDPAGKVLLSSDGIAQRAFAVKKGKIFAYAGTTHVVTACSGAKAIRLLPYHDTPNPGGEYKVWVTSQADHAQNGGFSPSASKTDNYKVRAPGGAPVRNTLTAVKFYDTNGNGVQDADEPVIDGWVMTLTNLTTGAVSSGTTGGNEPGSFTFPVSGNDSYAVSELPMPVVTSVPGGVWVATTPTAVGPLPGSLNCTVTFGNRCWVPAPLGGKTLGFWSNPNGQALIDAGDLADLNGLPLWGSPVFTGPADVHTYLLGANAGDMGYMLSAQLIATVLAVREGLVDPGAFVVYPGVGLVTVGDTIAAASAALGGSAPRDEQETLKNRLDNINNDIGGYAPAPPGTCDLVYPSN